MTMNPGKPTLLCALSFGVALLLLAGCGGGASSPAPSSDTPPAAYATRLSYTNPPLSGYSLQAEPASNGTSHLVLDLVGPAGTVARGVSIFLTADPAKVSWSQGSGSAFATPGTVFNLGSAPQAFVAKVSAAGALQAGIYQKAGTATYGSAPLVTLALDLKPGAVSPGSAVALAPSAGQVPVYVDQNGIVEAFGQAIAIGTLVAD
jgi:hypothetical protein